MSSHTMIDTMTDRQVMVIAKVLQEMLDTQDFSPTINEVYNGPNEELLVHTDEEVRRYLSSLVAHIQS